MKNGFKLAYFVFPLILLGLCISNIESQKLEFDATCPDVPAMTGFKESEFVGKWYQVGSYITWYDLAGHCNTKVVTGRNGTLKADLQSYNVLNGNNPFGISINLISKGDLTKGLYTAHITFPGFIIPIKIDYTVIDTDYNNYAVTYACMSVMKMMRLRFVWIYSRATYSKGSEFKTGLDVLDKKGINRTGVIPTDQYICPLFH